MSQHDRTLSSRIAPPSSEYLSPDPYPEDDDGNDEPLARDESGGAVGAGDQEYYTAADPGQHEVQHHDYDDADIESEDNGPTQMIAGFAQPIALHQQSPSPPAAQASPSPNPPQQQQQYRTQQLPSSQHTTPSRTIPPAQYARLQAISGTTGSNTNRQSGSSSLSAQQQQLHHQLQQQAHDASANLLPPPHVRRLSASKSQQRKDSASGGEEDNPFESTTTKTSAQQKQQHKKRQSSGSGSAAGAATTKRTTARKNSHEHAAPISASASPPPTTTSSAAAASSSASSLPHSSSFPNKMNSLIDRGLSSFERHSDSLINAIRGLEEADESKRRARVDDELLTSLNYDDISDHINQLALDESSSHSGAVLTLLQLLLTICIALITAVAMFLVAKMVDYCLTHRMDLTLDLIMSGLPYEAYFGFLGASIFLVTVATILVTYFAPHSKGGGVPYVQAYLNGTNVSSYFSPRIVLVKIAALPFTIASGLPLGMEGPFVYIGAGIAIILCKALDLFSFHQRLGGKYTKILKNINEERVFMAGGIAAGLAVAFNAPIAGVLMALEGSTAFLTVPVVLRIFGCAMFATFFNDLWHAGGTANIKTHNLIQITADPNRGAAANEDYAWVISEILAFTLIAILGGLLGAFAIWINVRVTKWRHENVEPSVHNGNKLNTTRAVSEVLILAFLIATAWFVLPYIFGCRMQHEQCFPTIAVPRRCMQVQCPDKYYSELGTLIYSPSDTIARVLFDRSLTHENDLHPFPLIIFASFYLFFVMFLYGAHVPGGLFVPSIVVGGCMGRVIAWGIYTYIPGAGTVNPGVYALLGAASMFGGFTRLALPAVIMLIEMTGDATYLLPIMFCTIVAKVVSDEIQPALYPQHMQIEGIPTLGDKLNPKIASLKAKHIMSRNFYSVKQVDTVSHLLDVLDKSRSMLLPVTTSDDKFVGMILRKNVEYAVCEAPKWENEMELMAAMASGAGASGAGDASTSGTTNDSTFGPNTKSLSAIERKMGAWDDTTVSGAAAFEALEEKCSNSLVNLTPFMDGGALTAHEETSSKRIAAIFRRLGISHLGVASQDNTLVGIITRRHLIKPPSEQVVIQAAVQQAVVKQKQKEIMRRQSVLRRQSYEGKSGDGSEDGGDGDAGTASAYDHHNPHLLNDDDDELDEDVMIDFSSYSAANNLSPTSNTADALTLAQRRSAATQQAAAAAHRRGGSASLLGYPQEPAVRFDDEEDEVYSGGARDPSEDYDENVMSSDGQHHGGDEDDEREVSSQQQPLPPPSTAPHGLESAAFRAATGAAFQHEIALARGSASSQLYNPRSRTNSDASTGSINTSGPSSFGTPRRQKSSIQRLNALKKNLGDQ